jgi:pyridinium-3,5-biscarboxylic acid mononucleotide synthase
MEPLNLETLLNQVRFGTRSVEEAEAMLRDLPYEDIGYARIDHDRASRKGFPEVVYCEGKTRAQVVEIMRRLAARHPRIMASRASDETFEAVRAAIPDAKYFETARLIVVDRQARPSFRPDEPYILVVSAGTADVPVAEEAAITAEMLGSRVERLYDVGVAGLHRLLSQLARLQQANVIVAVAGLDGVLPAVVAGLVASPVIAVPTSVGYGTGWGGAAALLTMLNSCAPGLAVVNIDNGFGAGFFAHGVNQRNRPSPSE